MLMTSCITNKQKDVVDDEVYRKKKLEQKIKALQEKKRK